MFTHQSLKFCSQKDTGEFEMALQLAVKHLTLWPLSRSDLLLISPYNNTPNSSITIMRIQEGSPI